MTGHLLLALALAGSQSLGYESPYVGVRAEGGVEYGSLVAVGSAAYFDSKKIETGDGFGLRGQLLAGVKITEHLAVLGGGTYTRQETSSWQKDGVAPTVRLVWSDDQGTLLCEVERLDNADEEQWVGALEARVGETFPLFGRIEYVDYKTLFAEGNGQRYEIGVLVPLWRGR